MGVPGRRAKPRGRRLNRHVVRRPHTPGATAQDGLTLVELLVTIVVAAILAAFAVPSFLQTLRSNRADTLANQLVATLAMARSEAVKLGQPVTVLSTSGSTNWGVNGWCATTASAPTNASCTPGAAGIVQGMSAVTTASSSTTLYASVSQLAFDASGHLMPLSNGLAEADFVVCADGQTLASPLAVGVNVIAFGRARVGQNNAGGVPLHNDGVTPAASCTQP